MMLLIFFLGIAQPFYNLCLYQCNESKIYPYEFFQTVSQNIQKIHDLLMSFIKAEILSSFPEDIKYLPIASGFKN